MKDAADAIAARGSLPSACPKVIAILTAVGARAVLKRPTAKRSMYAAACLPANCVSAVLRPSENTGRLNVNPDKNTHTVIPAQAGIQFSEFQEDLEMTATFKVLDSCLRGNGGAVGGPNTQEAFK